MRKEKRSVDPKRSEACKRSWITIRKNRALKAAGLPVPESKTAKAKQPAKDYNSLISAWLAEPEAPAPEAAPAAPKLPAREKRVGVHMAAAKGGVECGSGDARKCATVYAEVTCKACLRIVNRRAAAA